MKSIEELNKRVKMNSIHQKNDAYRYFELIRELIQTHGHQTVDKVNNTRRTWYIYFHLTLKMDGIEFERFSLTTNEPNRETSFNKYMDICKESIMYLYNKDHGETVDKFIDYLVDYALPHLMNDSLTPTWDCGNVL